MKLFHISAECYPIAKVGGLADVVGALPKYQNNLGHSASVIMPYYDNAFTQAHIFSTVYEAPIVLGDSEINFKVLKTKAEILNFEVFFIAIPELLFKAYVYSNNDTDRFLAFQIAALDWILTLTEQPEIIHCHDHHTGLIPFMLQECYKYQALNTIPVLTTIHNAQYQGWFGYDKLHLIPEFDTSRTGLLDWDNNINPLASAIKCAWRVTTVSPSYMEELKMEANGLQSLLSAESDKCIGILNGIDSDVWNPETDSYIKVNYNLKTVHKGKLKNKLALCKTFDLDETKPLIIFIGRLVYEKGADVFPLALEKALEDNRCSVLVLGSGNYESEQALLHLKEKYIGHYNAFIGYDEALSHNMYAGADFLLMPSRVEPCGLNQLYALRYGTIPVVRSIGGLKDTVIDINEKDGFGISHEQVTVEEIYHAINRSIDLYNKTSIFKSLTKHIMTIDHSWDVSAKAYINLYQSLKK
ncbi:glycogen synthase [Olleya sp. HaHaR_3_96]|uniref:glycogen synthase n=1 Tax=Olleya sp. HaHaR_3_96 TaxID=2745560 RepID=UPI001C4F2E68|nr:glycogen synthase [Olleya sp. HaHaR_3_96]QXP59119.1 glycogen synthase [Olleya sp. HaHaR_3_96]